MTLDDIKKIGKAALINGLAGATAAIIVALNADPKLAVYAAIVQTLAGFFFGSSFTISKPKAVDRAGE